MENRRKFTREFKVEAVQLVLGPEAQKLKAERGILKKSAAYFAKEST